MPFTKYKPRPGDTQCHKNFSDCFRLLIEDRDYYKKDRDYWKESSDYWKAKVNELAEDLKLFLQNRDE